MPPSVPKPQLRNHAFHCGVPVDSQGCVRARLLHFNFLKKDKKHRQDLSVYGT